MQIFGMPSQVPILIVESHAIQAERIVPDFPHGNIPIGLPATEKSQLLTMAPSHGKVLRIVVFVHGFQVSNFSLVTIQDCCSFLKKQHAAF
jgi:hypothetical protein